VGPGKAAGLGVAIAAARAGHDSMFPWAHPLQLRRIVVDNLRSLDDQFGLLSMEARAVVRLCCMLPLVRSSTRSTYSRGSCQPICSAHLSCRTNNHVRIPETTPRGLDMGARRVVSRPRVVDGRVTPPPRSARSAVRDGAVTVARCHSSQARLIARVVLRSTSRVRRAVRSSGPTEDPAPDATGEL